jgi:hypothetical protein
MGVAGGNRIPSGGSLTAPKLASSFPKGTVSRISPTGRERELVSSTGTGGPSSWPSTGFAPRRRSSRTAITGKGERRFERFMSVASFPFKNILSSNVQ